MEQKEFFKAISEGKVSVVQGGLETDRSLAKARNENGVSAIMFSLYMDKLEIVDLLLNAHSSLDIFEAAAVGIDKDLEHLVRESKTAVNSYSSDGFTPLHLSCFFGKVNAARILIQAGANPNLNSKNGANLKPINSAAACRDLEAARKIVELLLSAGADISVKQNGGYTALHSASANGNVLLVKLLLARGADRNALSDDKKTPLQFAQERSRSEVVALLI